MSSGHYDITPPYLTIHAKGVSLFLDISYLPKVLSVFYVQATIHLPAFSPTPTNEEEQRLHTLDIK